MANLNKIIETVIKHLAGQHDQRKHAGIVENISEDEINDNRNTAFNVLYSIGVPWAIVGQSFSGEARIVGIRLDNPALRRSEFKTWAKDPQSLAKILAIGEFSYRYGYEDDKADETFDKLLSSGLIKKLKFAAEIGDPTKYIRLINEGVSLETYNDLIRKNLLPNSHPAYTEFIAWEQRQERDNTEERIKAREETAKRTDYYPKPPQVVNEAAKIAGYKVINNWKDLAELSNRHHNCLAIPDFGWPQQIKNGNAFIIDADDASIAVAKRQEVTYFKNDEPQMGNLKWELVESKGVDNINDPNLGHTAEFVDLLNELEGTSNGYEFDRWDEKYLKSKLAQ